VYYRGRDRDRDKKLPYLFSLSPFFSHEPILEFRGTIECQSLPPSIPCPANHGRLIMRTT